MGKITASVEPFYENAVYTTEMAAKFLHRHPNTVRFLCRRGLIAARCDRGGYLISGWAIRAYVEGALPAAPDGGKRGVK